MNSSKIFNRKFRKLICIVLSVVVLLSLSGCKKYTCYKCDKAMSKAYYEFSLDEDMLMCEECARKYWMPLDYRTYQVK